MRTARAPGSLAEHNVKGVEWGFVRARPQFITDVCGGAGELGNLQPGEVMRLAI